MRAVVFYKYGGPEVLALKSIAKPLPRPFEVLIKVKASSINSWDYELLKGTPFANRFMFGLFRPKKINILGSDLSGIVEEVGRNVTKFKPGDEVFGDQSGGNWGGFAEYTCAHENNLILKPTEISFEVASCLPQAGLLAFQALRDYAQVKTGQEALINGAGGGAGCFAIQLAKMYGAHVTAVDTKEKFEIMKELGADEVIDFNREDYTKTGKYDIIIDNIARRSFFDYKGALKEDGIFGLVGGKGGTIFQILILGAICGGNKKLKLVLHQANKGLESLTNLVKEGKIKVIVDKTFNLDKTNEAFEHFAANQFKGKIVVKP